MLLTFEKAREQSVKCILVATQLGHGSTLVAVVEVGADEAKQYLESLSFRAAGSIEDTPFHLGSFN